MSNQRTFAGKAERLAPRFGDHLFRSGKSRERSAPESGEFLSFDDSDPFDESRDAVLGESEFDSESVFGDEVFSARGAICEANGMTLSRATRQNGSDRSSVGREGISRANGRGAAPTASETYSRTQQDVVSRGGIAPRPPASRNASRPPAASSTSRPPAAPSASPPVVSHRAVALKSVEPALYSAHDTSRQEVARAPRTKPDLSQLHAPARHMAERWAPPQLLQESAFLPQQAPVQKPSKTARPRRLLQNAGITPKASSGQGLVEELRDQIEKNRMRQIANATKSPYSQQAQMKLLGGSISGFAIVSGLTIVITIAAGLLYNQASKATKLALDPAATAITSDGAVSNTSSKSEAR